LPMAHAEAFTAAEVSALLGVDEKVLRKEIEVGVFDDRTPVRFSFGEAIYIAAMAALGVRIAAVEERRMLRERIEEAVTSRRRSKVVSISQVFELHLDALVGEVSDRIDRFEKWKRHRVVEDEKILAGEPVFRGSRLSLRNVGEMILRGDARLTRELREDYPYLTEEDIEFAPKFTQAYPRRGRPREAPAR
ncbi:MAG: DUF433 domain-containing protein, partial [Polyangiales bacterium]